MTEKTEAGSGEKKVASAFGKSISYRIAHLAHHTNMLVTDYLTPLKLTLPQCRVLIVLHYYGKLTIGDISRHALIRQSTLSRVVDRMEELKLVKRNSKSGNRRLVHVSLAKKGQDMYETISPFAPSLNKLLASALSDEELETLMQIFDKLSDKLDEGRLGIK